MCLKSDHFIKGRSLTLRFVFTTCCPFPLVLKWKGREAVIEGSRGVRETGVSLLQALNGFINGEKCGPNHKNGGNQIPLCKK